MALFINRMFDTMLLSLNALGILLVYLGAFLVTELMPEALFGFGIALRIMAFLGTIGLVMLWCVRVHKRMMFYRLHRVLSAKLRDGDKLSMVHEDGAWITFICDTDGYTIASDQNDSHLLVALVTRTSIVFEKHLHSVAPLFEEINGRTDVVGEYETCSSEPIRMVGSGLYMRDMRVILEGAPPRPTN